MSEVPAVLRQYTDTKILTRRASPTPRMQPDRPASAAVQERPAATARNSYRGTSIMKNCPPLGP